MDLNFFNPKSQKEEDFLINFVARQNTLNFFLQQLRHLDAEQTARQVLIVAPRGYGKTSLLRRISIAIRKDAEFNSRYIALTFREEQHNIISLDLFWRNCLLSLQEAREDEGAPDEEIEELEHLLRICMPRNMLKREDQDGQPAWQLFQSHCHKLSRRPILLIDNLDSMLAGLVEHHQWALRRTLQLNDGPVLIAAASRYPESTSNVQAAFYDFFSIHNLAQLTDEEVLQCLRILAEHRGAKGKKVIDLINSDAGRISALNTLAGGNPRTLNVLYSVLEADMSKDILSQLSSMLDTFTGWYQARTEEIPIQARAVFDALALNWNPIKAADLSAITGLETAVVSSQLSRLEKSGHAESVALSSKAKGRNGYQVSERFYNIWYLMRNGPRRAQKEVKFLTVFLQICFNPRERNLMVRDSLNSKTPEPAYLLALASSVKSNRMRQQLLDRLPNDDSLANNEREYLSIANTLRSNNFEVTPRLKNSKNASTTNKEIEKKYEKVKEALAKENYKMAEDLLRQAIALDPRESISYYKLGNLLQDHSVRYDEAESAYRQAIALDPKDASSHNNLGDLLQDHLARYDEAESTYRQAIALSPKEASSHNNLGDLLKDHLARYDEAESAYRQAIALGPKEAISHHNLGDLLHYRLARYDEAESAYRQAIALDPKFAGSHHNLGDLLQDHLARYDEAESAYRQAIALDPKFAGSHHNLGILLHYRLARYDEAESAYRQAIALDPKFAGSHHNLGNLLHYRLARYDEAESAYRQAIALDPKFAGSHHNLGDLLQDHLARYDEAESAYRQAIALDPKFAGSHHNLGILLHYRLARYDEAESAYRQAIALDPMFAGSHHNLGNLLQDHSVRYDEAESAYRLAIALSPKEASSHNNLGDLLKDHLARYDEAESAYRQAIALGPKEAISHHNLGDLLHYRLARYDEAESAYRQAIALSPKEASSHHNLGDLLKDHLARYDEAESAYRQAIALDPKFAGSHHNLGYLLHYRLARYDEAESAYRQAIALDPKFAGSHHNLGDLLQDHLARYDEAESAYRQAIALDPKFAGSHHNLGILLHYRLARYDEAESAYRQAIALSPKEAISYHNLGYLLHYRLARYDEAESAYRQAIALSPKEASSHHNLGDLLKDHLALYDEAESAYRHAISLAPDDENIWMSIGNLYLDITGNVKKAVESYLKGLSINDKNEHIHANYAYALALHGGDPNDAEMHLQQALVENSSISKSGKELLRALPTKGLSDESWRLNMWNQIQLAVRSDDPDLWVNYLDDLQRLLQFIIAQSQGNWLKEQMKTAQFDVQYAPLYVAFVAALEGEDVLLQTNPETRQPAKRIYDGLAHLLKIYGKK